jgi:hypothetical protein
MKRELIVQVDGKHYRGTWETWEDHAWGRMVEVSYHESWIIRRPVGHDSPEHAAERSLDWCVRESVVNDPRR